MPSDGVCPLSYLKPGETRQLIERPAVARAGAHARAEALALLRRRDLLEHVDGGYRFQVELIRRWFAR